jgi:hypothetical protein
MGNLAYVLLWHFLFGKQLWRQGSSLLLAAGGKFLILYLLVVQLLCRILPLAEKQVATFTAMFSWPQLITALIGGAVALLVTPVLRKALHR